MNKWLAYIASILFAPIAGVIIYLVKGGQNETPEDRKIAKNCLWISIIISVITVASYFLLVGALLALHQ